MIQKPALVSAGNYIVSNGMFCLRQHGNDICSKQDPLSHLKNHKWGYLVFERKKLEPREFPWQKHNSCHFVSFVMYISGAKFEEHCSNISKDIPYSVFYCFTCKHNIKTSISLK